MICAWLSGWWAACAFRYAKRGEWESAIVVGILSGYAGLLALVLR